MKMLMMSALILSGSAFAATTSVQDCFKIKNGLDRKYCMDKYIEGVKNTLGAEKKTWAKGLDKKDKAAKETALADSLKAKKDYIMILQEEIALTEKHMTDLKAVKVAKEEKKKKKKDSGFKIKL